MVRRGFGCRAPAAVSSVENSNKRESLCRTKFTRLLLTTGVVSVGLSLAPFDAAAVTGCSSTTTTIKTITCTSSGNNYTTGIPYTTNTLDLTLIVEGTVVINTTSIGINLDNSDTDNDLIVDIITGTMITTTGSTKHGVYIDGAASVDLYSAATISTTGTDANAIFIDHTLGNVLVTTAGNITTNGKTSRGILVSHATGSVTITSSSDITTTSNVTASYSSGIWVGDSGDVFVTSTGDIKTYGDRSRGILVTDSDDVTINSQGDITTHFNSTNNAGILTARNESVDVTAAGIITTAGSAGIEILETGGDVSVTLSGEIIAGTSFMSLPTTTSSARGIEIYDSAGAVDVYLSQDSNSRPMERAPMAFTLAILMAMSS